MKVLRVAGFSPISADPERSISFYRDDLGIEFPIADGQYYATESLDGCQHFSVWPLSAAAQSCFGTDTWPDEIPTPHAALELEVADVAASAQELVAAGHTLIHGVQKEPWGQMFARVLSPEGILVGLCHTPDPDSAT